MSTQFFDINEFEVSEEDDSPILRGYAFKFGDYTQNKGTKFHILPNATVKLSSTVRALVGHDYYRPLGNTADGSLKLDLDKTGLKFSLRPHNYSYTPDIMEGVRTGDFIGMSFEARNVQEEYRHGIINMRSFEVPEITVTPQPAFSDTELATFDSEEYRLRLMAMTMMSN